ncbi:bacteriocin secretion accessory protein [Enterococcus casseliflavus]|jgi:competence factor transport accessory protein ComB|uniref:bacteriocin secretion accessory protein n=1 Tax=Enterococcus casseliflavus TaxID=37734 RepID=UPI000FF8B4FC|nr:bacteriocin secretion accessory protein [Enterococcus casseliflavus]RXA66986.1 bacteriocin secretion accessory protein [Enterococcus casseliflavus]
MNNEWKNTSTIYLQQYSHYYRWILYPLSIFFLGVLLFLFFGSSEQVVHGNGMLSAETIIPIQIPVEASIKENNLKENLKVNKGDTLIVFEMDDLVEQKNQLDSEIKILDEKIEKTDLLIKSLQKEENLFTEEDSYGYSNQVESFLNEKEQVLQTVQQLESNYQNTSQIAEKNIYELNNQIQKNQNRINEMKEIRISWSKQQMISGYSDEYMSKYTSWKKQIDQVQETEKDRIKSDVLSEIDQTIMQLDQIIDQLSLQKEAIEIPVDPTSEVNSQIAVINQLREQKIADAKNHSNEMSIEKKEKAITLKSIERELTSQRILATDQGTIHLKESYENTKDIAKGSVVAEIYKNDNQNTMVVEAQVTSEKMTAINVGMPISMRLDSNDGSKYVLKGKVTDISTTSSVTEVGNFFAVKGQVKIPVNKQEFLRYGLTGDVSFIVGKKSYWDQIIDFLFSNN